MAVRVGVGMSGGVDSSVAALVLKNKGYDVVGLTLKVWENSRCCSLEDVADARRVANHLEIPFFVLDAFNIFDELVVRPFVNGYGEALTPNPCVWCNQRIKFAWLLGRAKALGCEAVATGHYARVDGAPGERMLSMGRDREKDQSYFLVPDHPDGLDNVLFPLGELEKSGVRRLAEEVGLPVAKKSDSQDICFVEHGDLDRFLRRQGEHYPEGEIVDESGKVIGRHGGIHGYTVGQRRGLGVSAPKPLYVIRKESATNRLVLGERSALMRKRLNAAKVVWMHPGIPYAEKGRFECEAKIRSTAPPVKCSVLVRDNRAEVEFVDELFGVAPGQYVAFYHDEVVLGGGWIT